MKNTSERLIKSIVDLRKKIYIVQEKLDGEVKVRKHAKFRPSTVTSNASVSAQKRHGEEVVGITQGYFSSEEIIVCATTHSQSHAFGGLDDGHDIAQQLSGDESIGCRLLVLIFAADQKVAARQITQDQLGKRVSQFVSSKSRSSSSASSHACQEDRVPFALLFISQHCQ